MKKNIILLLAVKDNNTLKKDIIYLINGIFKSPTSDDIFSSLFRFSQERYNQLDSFSSLHKLNHHDKFDGQNNTLYKYLLYKYKIDLEEK